MNKMRDRERRAHNLIWTVADNYALKNSPPLFSPDTDPVKEFYHAALTGFIYRLYDGAVLSEMIAYYGSISSDIACFLRLFLRVLCEGPLEKERPGLAYARNKLQAKELIFFEQTRDSTLCPLLSAEHAARANGHTLAIAKSVKKILNDWAKISLPENTKTLFDLMVTMVNRYFAQSLSPVREKAQQNTARLSHRIHEKRDKKAKIDHSPQAPERELDFYQVHSAEFTTDFLDKEKLTPEESDIFVQNQNTKSSDIFTLAEEFYGRSILPLQTRRTMEQTLCQGIHRGEQLLFTRGEFGNELNARFRDDLIQQQYVINKKHYEKNRWVYERFIQKLYYDLRYELIQDRDEQAIRFRYGRIDPGKVWQHTTFGNGRVFRYAFPNEPKEPVVDLLIDASASQIERQSEVCAQAYVIAEALCRAAIPVRVLSYNNFYQIQIIKLYRDYYDPAPLNDGIFRYHASGSNRDGLAIKTVVHTLNRQDDRDHIVIILTDGRPNDIVHIGRIGTPQTEAVNYEGREAIHNTAREVFQARRLGISLLGVFTGDKKDLSAMKHIYGQDFCVIAHLERFSEIVSFYLRRILQ